MLTFKPASASMSNMTYDANGNLTTVTNNCGTTTYIWNARNQLIGITGYRPDCSPLTASFKYDALNRRIEKTINGVTTKYLYDGFDIIQEKNASGAVTVNYIRTLNIDEPLTRIKADGTIRHYVTDALGSVIGLTDDTGVLKTTYSYDPFGNVTVSGETSDNPFQYTGRENDGTGLYYYRARYYSPEFQRFISEDPIGFEGGDVNLYLYVHSNPVNYVDPLGLVTWPTNYPVVTSPYGPRGGGFHSGIDIRNPLWGTVYATDSGIVIKVWHDSKGGNQILILNDDGSVSGYAHTAPIVKQGQRVIEGQPIGYSDDSGSGAPHLHYTYRSCATCPKIDPMRHLNDAKEPCK